MIEAAGRTIGSVWGAPRPRARASRAARRPGCSPLPPTRSARPSSRIGSPPRPQAAEIARQSDALKSALLESVSHDLRTPLATIRAAAGTILDRQLVVSDEDRRASALAIDREAEHLNRLVTNLLDLSRIEAGALRADLSRSTLADVVEPAVDRLADRLGDRTVEMDLDGPAAGARRRGLPRPGGDQPARERREVTCRPAARGPGPRDAGTTRVCG